MRIHLHSAHGDTVFLARRFLSEDHEVSVWIQNPRAAEVGKGFVTRLRTPAVPERTDLCIFDDVGKGDLGAQLRKRGIAVLGGNPFDRDLELDRIKATTLMSNAGIRIPETHAFTDISKGVAFLLTHPGHWFLKPSGNPACDLTANGDAKYVTRYLRWATRHQGDFKAFILQKAVEGTEVSVQGWFDGTKFVLPFDSTLETKKFLAGDRGPRVGCMANVVWPWREDAPELAVETILKMAPILRREGFVGPFDANTKVTKQGKVYVLEFTARIGLFATQAWSMLVDGNLGNQLSRFARGQLKRFELRPELALALGLSVPPWPNDTRETAQYVDEYPLDPDLLKQPERTFLDDVKMKEGLPVLAGRDGSIGCIGAAGPDYAELERVLLARAERMQISGLQYRPDVIPDARERWSALAKLGYLDGKEVPPDQPKAGGAQDDTSDDEPPFAPFVEDVTAS